MDMFSEVRPLEAEPSPTQHAMTNLKNVFPKSLKHKVANCLKRLDEPKYIYWFPSVFLSLWLFFVYYMMVSQLYPVPQY